MIEPQIGNGLKRKGLKWDMRNFVYAVEPFWRNGKWLLNSGWPVYRGLSEVSIRRLFLTVVATFFARATRNFFIEELYCL